MNYTPPPRKQTGRLMTPVRLGVVAVAACFLSAPVLSNPVNPTVVNGTATFNQAGNVLTVTNSNGAIINWDKFSIAAGEKTHFEQSSASSSVLNRVLSDPTAIYGTLSSNGRVWLINPAGIMVGAGGRVDTAAFVASTLNIRNEDFLAGRNLFINDGTAKDVINQGEIKTPAGGSVYLIGANVKNESVAGEANSGIITTPGGETILAAGATVSLIDSALPGIKVDITGATGNATNLGTITAEAGRIGIAGVIVKNSGTLNASSVVSEGGRIFLKASQDAYVDGNGRIVTTGSKGGSVEVLGNRVAVMDNASIDASATSEGGDGGTIKVGGDYQGKNPDIQNANITYFGPDASLKADAGKVGAGGTVIVWADDITRAYGNISARGGALGGNGGFVETSGKRYLDIAGVRVDAAAMAGVAGQWLLDPNDIEIFHGASGDSQITGGTPFAPTQSDSSVSLLSDATINAAINGGTSVTIETANSYGGGTGDIIFDGTVGGPVVIEHTAAAATTLTLDATNDIRFKGSTSFKTSGGSTGLTVVMNPGASGKVTSYAVDSAVVNLNGLAGQLEVQVNGGGKTWENSGTVNVAGNSTIRLYDDGSTYYSTFFNQGGGALNLGSSFGWSFLSNSGTQKGLISNAGTINVTTGTSWEAKFAQAAGGVLNISAGKVLSMQNADVIYGGVNIGLGGELAISEAHDGSRTFDGATITGPGTLNLLQATTFFGSTMNGGILAKTNGGLGIPGSGLTFSGDMTFASTSGVTFVAGTYNLNSLSVVAGWNGSSSLTAPVTPNAGNISLPAGVFLTANDVSMRTGSGGISQASGGAITADSLIATSYGSGTVGFSGNNKVDYVTLYSAGDLNYNSYQSFHLVKATASTGPGVVITTSSGSPYGGNVYLGEISSGTAASVSAYGGIYDDNGSGVVNITAGTSASLTSFGGTAGDLAISSDVKAGSATSATVAPGSTYGGIRLWAIDYMPGGNMNLTDEASYQPSIGFYYGGSIANPGIVNLNAGANGDMLFAVGGDLTGAPNVTVAPVNGKLILAAGGTLSLPAAFGSSTYKLGLLGSSVVINGAVQGSEIAVGAGSLTIDSGGSLFAAATLFGAVVNDVNINGGYIKTGTGDLELMVGGDLNISNGGHIWAGYNQWSPSYTPDASILVGGDLKLNNGAHINAANDVYLDLMGSSSTLVLNDGTAGYSASYILSDIGTGIPATTHLAFAGRSSGGVVIDGIETTTTAVGGSGFFAVNTSTPAIAGAGLEIAYSGATLDICVLSPDLCKPPPPTDNPIDEPPPSFDITGPGGTQPGSGTGGTTAGGTEGSFGGDDSGGDGTGGTDDKDDKKDEKDKDKDKKADNGKEEKKDEKSGQKKVAQCS
jgi:filamentous hemagglutinin family protein